MDINIALSPGIVYAMLATVVAVTVVVSCYLDARNRVREDNG